MFRTPQTIPASIAQPPVQTQRLGRVSPIDVDGMPADLSGSPAATPSEALLEASFRAWVEGPVKADVLVIGNHDPVKVPLERALHLLSTSTRPLAPAHGDALGLDPNVTIGMAAVSLLQACADPAGPRCRSYRSASYFLIGRAVLTRDEQLENGGAEALDVASRWTTHGR